MHNWRTTRRGSIAPIILCHWTNISTFVTVIVLKYCDFLKQSKNICSDVSTILGIVKWLIPESSYYSVCKYGLCVLIQKEIVHCFLAHLVSVFGSECTLYHMASQYCLNYCQWLSSLLNASKISLDLILVIG